MLDEYLTHHLEEIEYEYLRLTEELQRLVSEENILRDEIDAILQQEDVGLEIFSPRSNRTAMKDKIAEIRKHIDDLQYQQAKISDQIAENRAKEEHYQLLLAEARHPEISGKTDGTTEREDFPETQSINVSRETLSYIDGNTHTYMSEGSSISQEDASAALSYSEDSTENPTASTIERKLGCRSDVSGRTDAAGQVETTTYVNNPIG